MNRQSFSTHIGVELRTLDFWIEQEWLVPAGTADDANFSDADIARAHLIQDLKGSFGVNDEGIDVILHLLDQLHGFRRAFERLHADFETPREGAGSADEKP